MRLLFNKKDGDQWHLKDELAPQFCAIKRRDGAVELWTDDAERRITVGSAVENWSARQFRKLAKVFQDAFAESESFGRAQFAATSRSQPTDER